MPSTDKTLRTVFAITNCERASEMYGGPAWPRIKEKSLVEHHRRREEQMAAGTTYGAIDYRDLPIGERDFAHYGEWFSEPVAG